MDPITDASPLLHIISRTDWSAALNAGVYAPVSLAAEGFIHLSTPELVLFPANAFYAGRDDLVLLEIDPSKLTAEVRFEPSDNRLFPHLYGPLNLDAVAGTFAFTPDIDGRFALPAELHR